jgi:hypothetical protein
MQKLFSAGLVILLLIMLSACSEPPVPPEVQLALSQEQNLWRAGANVYAPTSYAIYLAALQTGRDQLAAEQARLAWFRDYDSVTKNFRAVLAQGEQLQQEVVKKQAQQTNELIERTSQITERLLALRFLTNSVKDSRLNSSNLSRIEILLAEAASFTASSQPDLALARLDKAEDLLSITVDRIRPILSQYIDDKQVSRWKQLVDEVIDESRRCGGHAIVVNKLRRQLILYEKGVVQKSYPVGLSFNPIGDKLYAGDRATPEGRYHVVSKLPNSRYYRALLLNYPNEEDQRRFAEAKRKKLIPANAKIGGLIEIHGGGKDGATLGCIGLNNPQMLELFNRIEVNTPVVIVAAMKNDNLVRIALGRLE